MTNYQSTVPTNVLNYALSQVPAFSDWVCYTASENAYVMCYKVSGDWKEFTIARSYSGGYNYTVSAVTDIGNVESPTYPLYAYSSVESWGTYVSNPRSSDAIAMSTGIITVAVLCAIMFGVMFRKR